jgi:hypothetical protein
MQLSLDSGHCTGLISIESSDFLRQISSDTGVFLILPSPSSAGESAFSFFVRA